MLQGTVIDVDTSIPHVVGVRLFISDTQPRCSDKHDNFQSECSSGLRACIMKDRSIVDILNRMRRLYMKYLF